MRSSEDALKYGDVRVSRIEKGFAEVERRYRTDVCRAYVCIGERREIKVRGDVIFGERAGLDGGKLYIDNCGFLLCRET